VSSDFISVGFLQSLNVNVNRDWPGEEQVAMSLSQLHADFSCQRSSVQVAALTAVLPLFTAHSSPEPLP
jgi:hypothetical protein